MIKVNELRPWRLGAAAVVLSLAIASGVRTSDAATGSNEFRRVGDTVLCVTLGKSGKPTIDPNLTDANCLRIGRMRLGQSAAKIRQRFGKPYKTVKHNGATAAVYVIKSEADSPPYWVISEKRGKVVSIQITGESEPNGNAFSSLRLGDPEDKVRRLFGEPTSTAPVKSIGATVWFYRPLSFSIEIKDERIYSMKVWQPR